MRRRAWQWRSTCTWTRITVSRTRAATKSTTAQPKQGTTKFHAYASACIVQYGRRYTLALTWVRRHESMVAVLRRLLARIREIGLKIKYFLLDRGFFSVRGDGILAAGKLAVLDAREVLGAASQKGLQTDRPAAIKRQPAGWYSHTMKSGKRQVTFSVCVGYRRYRDRKDGKQKAAETCSSPPGGCMALPPTFASVTANGSASKRVIVKGGKGGFTPAPAILICDCSSSPWGSSCATSGCGFIRCVLPRDRATRLTLHLELLRFNRMLHWIVHEVVALLHDGSTPYVIWPP